MLLSPSLFLNLSCGKLTTSLSLLYLHHGSVIVQSCATFPKTSQAKLERNENLTFNSCLVPSLTLLLRILLQKLIGALPTATLTVHVLQRHCVLWPIMVALNWARFTKRYVTATLASVAALFLFWKVEKEAAGSVKEFIRLWMTDVLMDAARRAW